MAEPLSEELKQRWKENILKQRQSKLSIAAGAVKTELLFIHFITGKAGCFQNLFSLALLLLKQSRKKINLIQESSSNITDLTSISMNILILPF